MRTEEEVKQFLTIQLRDKLLPLEEYRLRRIKWVKAGATTAAISLGLAVCGALFSPLVCALLIISTLLLAGMTAQWIQTMNAYLRSGFKHQILNQLLGFLFDEFTYIPNQRISRSTLGSSLLISGNIKRVTGEDYMRFRLGSTSIHFCETMVYGQAEDYPIFTGVFLSATFNKHFRSQTIVMPRNYKLLLKNYERLMLPGFEKVILEDVEFNRHFLVWSNDQVESRYILTTSMMQRMLDYKLKTGKTLAFSFTGNLLNCAIPSKINLFEPALFESFFEFEFLRKSYDALKLYTDIVDDLNLNVRIWTEN